MTLFDRCVSCHRRIIGRHIWLHPDGISLRWHTLCYLEEATGRYLNEVPRRRGRREEKRKS